MKIKIVTTVVLALVSLSACSTSAGYHTESVSVFATTIQDPTVVVLDVRTADEYASGHLPNAINIDVESGDFETGIAQLDKSKTYAVYCRSGRRSAVASEKMARAGFLSIHNMDGGISDWMTMGGEVVTQ